MSPYESAELSQEAFKSMTEDRLHRAVNEQTTQDAIDTAQEIVHKLDLVEQGLATIEPPLTDEQVDHYKHRALDVITLGERVNDSLKIVRKSRLPWKAPVSQSLELVPSAGSNPSRSVQVARRESVPATFQGNGSDVKR